MTTDSPKRAKFLPVPDKPEQRLDRDVVSVARLDERTDTTTGDQETRLRKLRDYFERPIPASAADDPVHLRPTNALRKHAGLDRIVEHPFAKRLRELRDEREANE